jgi:hypothetical protein
MLEDNQKNQLLAKSDRVKFFLELVNTWNYVQIITQKIKCKWKEMLLKSHLLGEDIHHP